MTAPTLGDPTPVAHEPALAGLLDLCRRQDRAAQKISDVQSQLRAIHDALDAVLLDPRRSAYWIGRVETYTVMAAHRVYSNKHNYYGLRGLAVMSSVVVPALVGLNLAGAGGAAVRWITFALSLIAALSSATMALFRYGDKWYLYRDLQNELLVAGWALVATNSDTASDPDGKAWTTFVTAADAAISKYNGAYDSELIAQTNAKAEGDAKTNA
jgi:hypothetical protein